MGQSLWEQGLPAMKTTRSLKNQGACIASKLCSHRGRSPTEDDLLTGFENHEFRRRGHLLDTPEQPRQFAVIAQVAVADDVQRAADH